MRSRRADEVWFKSFVDGARWRFAKTYVENYPHEYTLDEDGWCDEADFERAINCIERWGVEEQFGTARRKYLYVYDRMFWHMGDVESDDGADRPELINRSWVDLRRYCDDARRLGYEGEVLERLVQRWQDLLANARRGG